MARDTIGKEREKLQAELLRLTGSERETAGRQSRLHQLNAGYDERLTQAHAAVARGAQVSTVDDVTAEHTKNVQAEREAAAEYAGYRLAAGQVTQEIARFKVRHLPWFMEQAEAASQAADDAAEQVRAAYKLAAEAMTVAKEAWTELTPAARSAGWDVAYLPVNHYSESAHAFEQIVAAPTRPRFHCPAVAA